MVCSRGRVSKNFKAGASLAEKLGARPLHSKLTPLRPLLPHVSAKPQQPHNSKNIDRPTHTRHNEIRVGHYFYASTQFRNTHVSRIFTPSRYADNIQSHTTPVYLQGKSSYRGDSPMLHWFHSAVNTIWRQSGFLFLGGVFRG